MAGPYTGTWRASSVAQSQYTGAAKWGTGINPIHSIRTSAPDRGGPNLVYPPVETPGGQGTDTVTEDYSWDTTVNPDPYLEPYNITDSELYGYNQETGTSDRPGFETPSVRSSTQNVTHDPFPSWGGSRKSGPGGRFIRGLLRGATMIRSARVLPNEDVAQGWTNKTHGIAADSRPADDTQVFMQTSMVQRYKVREGSQRSGSQSDFSAPIESRVTGQKVKNWTTPASSRHWDMLPYEQVDYVRPFLSRQAGTGWREWALPNEMYVSPVLQREPAPDPELGPVAGVSYGDTLNQVTSADYGYSYEDQGYY
jgi:hypothetical protein